MRNLMFGSIFMLLFTWIAEESATGSTRLPSLGLASVLSIALSSPSGGSALAPWPFLLALLVLGLAHGAADGVVFLRGVGWKRRAVRIGVYLAMMLGSVLTLRAWPAPTVLGFLALSWWHFGAGDARSPTSRGASRALRFAWGFGRGGLAVCSYFLFVHGFRQSAALGSELLAGVGSSATSLAQRLRATHRASVALLLPSYAALAVLVLVAGPSDLRDLSILSLVLYVVATPPHHLFHEILS